MKKCFLGLCLSFLMFSCKKENSEIEVKQEPEMVITDQVDEAPLEIKPAPDFKLENIKGGFKSLNDFKGKLVLLDIWATWCGPCLAQIPYMKFLEEKYKNEPLEFVSISLDTEKDKTKWMKMVEEKEMGGVQLYAGATSDFALDYKVEFLPRFVLISPEGNILMNDTPQVINMDGDAVNEDMIKILDYSLSQIKKASQ